MARNVAGRIALGLLLAVAAMAAADFALWSLWRQQLQQRADLAALAGARAAPRGQAEAAALRALPPGLGLAESPVVEHPPSEGAYRGHPHAVRVRLTAQRSTLFSARLFGPAIMRAQGTAARLPARRPGTAMIARVE